MWMLKIEWTGALYSWCFVVVVLTMVTFTMEFSSAVSAGKWKQQPLVNVDTLLHRVAVTEVTGIGTDLEYLLKQSVWRGPPLGVQVTHIIYLQRL